MLKVDFINRMKEYLGDDFNNFLKSYEDENIRSFTVNNKYISTSSFKEIFNHNISLIPYMQNAFYLHEDDLKLGFHPLHHAGAIYMQDPSAMIPASCVEFKPNSLILDMCSAPGGKSIQLALKACDGAVISNEIDFKRAQILYSNIERLGLSNVVVTNNKPSDFLRDFKNKFDVILVDAPCSGEGMFRKYPNAIDEWSLDNVLLCQKRDVEILDTATQLLKNDGILIYSTCTFAKEENEDMVKYLMDTYGYSLVDIMDGYKPFLKEGFIPKTYRFYPHVAPGEGQFVAVLKKNDGSFESLKPIKKVSKVLEFDEFCNKFLLDKIEPIYRKGDDLFYMTLPVDLSSLRVLNYGVKLGEIYNKRFIPNHNLFKSFSHLFKSSLDLDYNDPLVSKYLHGEQIMAEVANGYGVIKVNGIPLGGYKASNNTLNNLYPKGLRNFWFFDKKRQNI